MTNPRCAETGLHVYECADCRTGKHTETYPGREPRPVVTVGAWQPASGNRFAKLPTGEWGIAGPGIDDTAEAVQGDVTYLLGHLDELADAAWVREAMAELKAVHDALRRAHGWQRPKSLGQCITVAEGAECVGQVMPSATGGKPRCTKCFRHYSERDLATLSISEDRAKPERVQKSLAVPPAAELTHNGRTGVDQSVCDIPAPTRALAGTLFTDERDAG